MAARSENERNKAVVDEFYKAGIQGHLTRFVQYLHPDFTWTAPNYLPWGGTHTGATLFRDQVLSRLPDVFDFTRFSYDNVVAEDGHVVAVINMGVTATDAIIKIADHWTVRDGKVASIWVAYFEPQALLEKLGIAHGLGRRLSSLRAYPTDVRHDRIHPPDRADTVRRG
jgi:ketosteroid isomerase-like protein